MIKKFTLFFLTLLYLTPAGRSQFVEMAAALNINVGSAKDGGCSWGDFNNDGCPDLLVNTDNNTQRTRLFLSDCNLPNPTFTDVTATHAAGLLNATTERSVVWADFNNDSYLDFARNTNDRFEVYINKGPAATPAYSFGNPTQNPNLVITNIANGMNTEGFGWMDYNSDGWLDLIIENHNFGIDIFQNPNDGSANFFHITPNGATLGLPAGGTTGDYMSLSDYNNDGYVDILARKQDASDLWTNTGVVGPGQFAANATFNNQANNSNKGGVLTADFDNDGDFDIFWSDNGNNEIFLQTAPGVFAATNEPQVSSGINLAGANIDGVASGDVNNDGKVDLFLADGSGASYLFLNNTPNGGALSFTRNNLGIAVDADAEGCAFVDYDRDGDLDLYININNGPNQFWRNPQNDANYLRVNAYYDLGASLCRHDVGATIVLKDCDGNVVSGIRDVNGTRGHGSQDVAEIHFGLPLGPGQVYVVEVSFTRKGAARTVLQRALIPNQLPNQTLNIKTSDTTDMTLCMLLPAPSVFELTGTPVNGQVDLQWRIEETEHNNFFDILRSEDGTHFSSIGQVPSLADASELNTYAFRDESPGATHLWYRIRSYDQDGFSYDSPLAEVSLDGITGMDIYPNPLFENTDLQVTLTAAEKGDVTLRIHDLKGSLVRIENFVTAAGRNFLQVGAGTLAPGMYIVSVHHASGALHKKVVVQ